MSLGLRFKDGMKVFWKKRSIRYMQINRKIRRIVRTCAVVVASLLLRCVSIMWLRLEAADLTCWRFCLPDTTLANIGAKAFPIQSRYLFHSPQASRCGSFPNSSCFVNSFRTQATLCRLLSAVCSVPRSPCFFLRSWDQRTWRLQAQTADPADCKMILRRCHLKADSLARPTDTLRQEQSTWVLQHTQ